MIYTYLALGLAILGLGLRVLQRPAKGSLPPGPKGLPLIGNLLQMPTERTWLTFSRWSKQWGDMFSVTILGRPIIIVNSVASATALLDKKSSIYSDRPELPLGGEMIGWRDALTLLRYGPTFQRTRKHFHQTFGTQDAAKRFYPYEEAVMKRFLRWVLENPDGLIKHIVETAGSVSLRIAYGYVAEENDDSFVHLVYNTMHNFSTISAPGAYFVDLFPALRHIPSWFPGAGFQKKAVVWARDLQAMIGQPYVHAKEQLRSGLSTESYSAATFSPDQSAGEDKFLSWTAGTISAAGLYTRQPNLRAIFLAMSLYPEVQKKAQAEIDAVVGNDRLPTFADRERLPYIDAVCKELLRFHAAVPTGLPHMAMEDDSHQGFFIPKGTIVIPNMWNMLHDPEHYKDPETFNPDRFLVRDGKTPERDVTEFIFGFGRRVCPGRVPAQNTLFLMTAMSLAVFDISKGIQNGKEIEPVLSQTTGTVSFPTDFQCTIRPRSAEAKDLILREQVEDLTGL